MPGMHEIETDIADGWLAAYAAHGIVEFELSLAKHAAFSAYLEQQAALAA